jgi:hypothetical protein
MFRQTTSTFPDLGKIIAAKERRERKDSEPWKTFGRKNAHKFPNIGRNLTADITDRCGFLQNH